MTLTDLTIGYENKVVQSHLTFTLEQGQLISLLGPNGSGKSTLLRTIAGLQPSLGGQILVNGIDISPMSPAERAKQQALVLTDNQPLEATTVFDIVALGRYPYTSFLGHLTQEDKAIITQSLESVGLPYSSTPLLPYSPTPYSSTPLLPYSSLSTGNQARVLIAKALAQQTPIILLDEPTAHLDLPGRVQLFELLQRLAHEQKKLILISTHELNLALRCSDHILLMSDTTEYATPAELRTTQALSNAFHINIDEYC